MHKDRAVKHWMCRLSISRMEANEKWDVERVKARLVKHDGPNGEDRVPVKEDDFLLAEDGILEEKVMSKEHKRSKHNEDVSWRKDCRVVQVWICWTPTAWGTSTIRISFASSWEVPSLRLPLSPWVPRRRRLQRSLQEVPEGL